MRPLVPVFFLFACSEYDLAGSGGAPPPGYSTTNDATIHFTGDECPDGAVDGFDADINDTCVNTIQTGAFNPVVKWSVSNFADGGANNVMMEPIVTTLTDDNGDGAIDENDTPDIVFIAYDVNTWTARVRAISGNDGHELWSYADPDLQITGGVAAGDLNGDGVVEVVAMLIDGVAVLDAGGNVEWKNTQAAGDIYGTSDVPAISDMDHDGNPEIIIGRAIIGNDGRVKGRGNHGMGGVDFNNVGTCSFAVDVDGDGQEEVVTGNALYRIDGSPIWFNGQGDGYPAVADFDHDGKAEIVASGEGEIRMIDTDGTLLWRTPIPGADSSYYGGPPTIADFDGDGEPEIGVASGSRYSVIEGDGTIRWQMTTDDSSSGNTGSAVFDFEGDGAAEVVYADQTTLWVFSGVDGSVKLESHQHSNGTWLEYPVIADVDADGHADIVVPQEYQYGGFTGITVFQDRDNTWMPGRRTWNQHAYYITNVNDDGSIPATAAQNWQSFNNFRSGDLTSGNGTDAPDLVVAKGAICEVECPGLVRLYVNPGNRGLADVFPGAMPGLTVWAQEASGDVLIGSQLITTTLYAGQYQDSVQFDIRDFDWTGVTGLRVEIDSQEPECDDTNNSDVFPGPFCQ